MINGWLAPAVGIFIVTQATAAVWWASGTDTEVKNNTTAIEQVIENEKQIAVIQVQQAEIVKDVGEIKDDNKEVKKMVNDILQTVNGWSNDD
jgi:beta-lactam-binding protein with PASTA domain